MDWLNSFVHHLGELIVLFCLMLLFSDIYFNIVKVVDARLERRLKGIAMKNSKLIKFDDTNSVHLDAFDYFAHFAGHPEYVIDDIVEDLDFNFREFVKKSFKLPKSFIEDSNGSCHQLVNRKQDQAKFNTILYYEDAEKSYSSIGTLKFNETSGKVVYEPDLNSIKEI